MLDIKSTWRIIQSAIWWWWTPYEDLYPDDDGFQITPRWHPMNWIGFKMRRWIFDEYSIGGRYDGVWRYYTHEECARVTLERRYCPTRRQMGV
jgi:hypothetical protein